MEHLRIQLRSVFYKESALWISHCLEMDVMGHGRTRQAAFKMMIGAIMTQIENSIKTNNRSNIFMPADARFFEMYSAGKNVTHGELVIKIHDEREKQLDDIRIENVESREYTGAYAHA